MSIDSEFSRFALEYDSYNTIQNKVASHLLSNINSSPQTILDLGCGSGAVARSIEWNYSHLIAVDFAEKMLELHPDLPSVERICADFNSSRLYEYLRGIGVEHIISASALQWSPDLPHTLSLIRSLKAPCSFAIFTSNTFKALHSYADLPPLLKSSSELKLLIAKEFQAEYETIGYTLEFSDTQQLFRYIKNSGVSGNRNLLTYTQTKELIRTYPLKYLEFEVLFVHTK